MIGAQVLNISKQDYEPQGASVNVLIAEEQILILLVITQQKPFFSGDLDSEGETAHEHRTVHAHLDKSHVTVHTFPEYHPDNSISTFRVDIDVSTMW